MLLNFCFSLDSLSFVTTIHPNYKLMKARKNYFSSPIALIKRGLYGLSRTSPGEGQEPSQSWGPLTPAPTPTPPWSQPQSLAAAKSAWCKHLCSVSYPVLTVSPSSLIVYEGGCFCYLVTEVPTGKRCAQGHSAVQGQR